MTMKVPAVLVVLASTLFLSLVSPLSLAVDPNRIFAPVILDTNLGPGSTLTLAINVTNIGPIPEDMDAWQVSVQLNPSLLRILNVRDGPVLDDIAENLGGTTFPTTQFNATAGTVFANELLILPGAPPQPENLGFTGSGDLVYIDVEVQAYGNSSISFDTARTYLRDIDEDVFSIDHEVRHGFFANVPIVLPPTAVFTVAPDRIFAGTLVTFDASESHDIDGAIVQYSWDFGDGFQSSETDPVATHVYAALGVYNATLTVIDDDGATGTATRTLIVGGQNLPPVVVFSFMPADPEVFEPVTFDATGSYDPEGRLALVPYLWDFGDGFTAGGLVVQHTYSRPGNYSVTLSVVDAKGQRGTTEQQVTVSPGPPNEPPVPIFTFDPANPHVGETVRFDATSSFDPDGSIIDYAWTFGDGPFSVPGQIVFHTFFSPGTFTVTLTVRDNRGQSASTSSQITVTPRPDHDVEIDEIIVSPSAGLVSGQFAVVTVIVENIGTHEENVTVTAYYDGSPIGSVTQRIFGSPFYVYYTYITIFWDTQSVPAGEYTISANAQIAFDEDPSNNAFTNGQVTILPPPTLDLSPPNGPVGTRVTVTGTGLPGNPFPQGLPRPILVSFDNQFLGYTFTTGTEFVFIFNVPKAEPGLHKINVLDVLTLLRFSTDFTVVDESMLDIELDVGSLYFEGDTAMATVQIQRNGHLVDATSIQATLMLPDGTSQTLSLRKVEGTIGLYRIEISIAQRNSVGTYNINVEASYQSDNSDSTGHALKSFTVKTAWLSPTRIRTTSVVGSLASVGLIGPILFKTYADRRARRKVPDTDAPPTNTPLPGVDAE